MRFGTGRPEVQILSPRAYFRAYLVTQPIYALLGYLAIAEVFYHVFKNFHQIRWFKFLFPGVGAVALGISVLIAAVHPPVQASGFLAAMFVLEIMVRCLQLGVFFLIFGLANFFDLFWRQYSFGIASGFGVAAFGLLTTTIVRFVSGTKLLFVFKFLLPVTYLIAVVIWLIAFLKPLPPDPLRKIRPLLTPEIMDEWADAFRRASKEIFKR